MEGCARHLDEIEFALRELVDEFDPNAVALCDARRWFQAADRIERVGAALKTLVAPRVDAAGSWKRGTVDDGIVFEKVFEPIVDAFFKAAHKEDRKEPVGAYAFDALIEMARRAVGVRSDEQRSARALQPLGMIRVDHAALVRGAVEGEEVCEIAGLGPIPARVARDLLGDAVVKLVMTKGVDVANVTHLGRGPTVAQKLALWWQVPQCTTLDCTRIQRLEFDHRTEWHKTHNTRLDDGDGLCGHCHHLKTDYGWALVEGTGKRPMVPPDDPRHPKNKPK